VAALKLNFPGSLTVILRGIVGFVVAVSPLLFSWEVAEMFRLIIPPNDDFRVKPVRFSGVNFQILFPVFVPADNVAVSGTPSIIISEIISEPSLSTNAGVMLSPIASLINPVLLLTLT
jgi:hypothetical protein